MLVRSGALLGGSVVGRYADSVNCLVGFPDQAGKEEMNEQCYKPDAPCSFRKECAKVSRCEYMMLRQAVNNVLHNGIEDSKGTHVQEQEMIDLRRAFNQPNAEAHGRAH